MYGIAPVIVAIVVAAVVGFARTTLTSPLAFVLAVSGGNSLAGRASTRSSFLPIGALVMAVARLGIPSRSSAIFVPWWPRAAPLRVDLLTIGAVFLKAGALLYGSGYVLIAFLQGDLVDRLGWLTDAQLIDAVAIGQVTPGPLFTTATFIGYVLAGVPGAVVATVAIFLPAFVIVALVGPWIGRVRERPITAALLDGVNAAAIGLMAAVSIQLGVTAVRDPLTALIAISAADGADRRARLIRAAGARWWNCGVGGLGGRHRPLTQA